MVLEIQIPNEHTQPNLKIRKVISLVIPTCNRVNELKLCLAELVPQAKHLANECEIIVSDDGLQESADRMIREYFPEVQWHRGPSRGPAANRNSGALVASGDWLIFLDDDIIPESGLLEAYRDEMAGPNLLEGKIINNPNPPSLLWEAPRKEEGNGILGCSCNFAIAAATFKKLGGFDERYESGVYAEDTDFSARLKSMGYEAAFVENATVVHPPRRIPGSYRLAKRWEGRVIFALDQGAPAVQVYCRLPWHVLRVIQSRFRQRTLSKDNFKAVWIFFLEWVFVLFLTPGWVSKWRKRSRSEFWEKEVRKSGPAPKYGF